jgi:hygromycin-B 7''-O-kinase
MNDINSHSLLNIDQESYAKQFSSLELGVDLASEIAHNHGYPEMPVRIPEGSSLVFKIGSAHYLKLTPPFLGDSIEAEILAAKVIGSQLSFPTPYLVAEGNVRNWKYLISRNVPGEQAKNVFGKMDSENRLMFAADIGASIKAINSIDSKGFERDFGPWDKYLRSCLESQKSIHLSRGNSEAWSDKIELFVAKYAVHLRALSRAKMIHADLNHEHLLLSQKEGLWRLSGIIDFADAMNAPIEMDFVLPIICFFKGKAEYQKVMFESAGVIPRFEKSDYSNGMMALALQNRFIAFHAWFDREIEKGAVTVEEVAAAIFPAF